MCGYGYREKRAEKEQAKNTLRKKARSHKKGRLCANREKKKASVV
jgi:hypothetical protein